MDKKGSSAKLQWGSWQIGGPRHYYRETLVMKMIKSVLPAGKILDVGCGTGSLMLQLSLSGYTVSGTDLSEECIRQTKDRMKTLAPGVKPVIKRCNAEAIDFPDGHFDGLIAAEILEHVDDDRKAVKEFHRLLKPGGLCLITVPANQKLWDISDEMAGHKRRYSRDDLMRLFNEQSFSIEKVVFLGFPIMRLYNRVVFLKWARQVEKKNSGKISSDDAVTKIGLNRWTTLILGNLFRFDNLFSSLPWGLGILLIARKNE